MAAGWKVTLDFVRDIAAVPLRLVSGRGHYDTVIDAIRGATRSVWIATANVKELLIEDVNLKPGRRRGRGTYGSILGLLSELATRKVELRMLHAAPPSRPFRAAFDAEKALIDGGLEMRVCPRVHLKLIVVDARVLYLGSANWTGAGLGAKGTGRRNFELGVVTEDDAMLDEAQGLFDHVWRGEACRTCKLRDTCEMPLLDIESAPRLT